MQPEVIKGLHGHSQSDQWNQLMVKWADTKLSLCSWCLCKEKPLPYKGNHAQQPHTTWDTRLHVTLTSDPQKETQAQVA